MPATQAPRDSLEFQCLRSVVLARTVVNVVASRVFETAEQHVVTTPPTLGTPPVLTLTRSLQKKASGGGFQVTMLESCS